MANQATFCVTITNASKRLYKKFRSNSSTIPPYFPLLGGCVEYADIELKGRRLKYTASYRGMFSDEMMEAASALAVTYRGVGMKISWKDEYCKVYAEWRFGKLVSFRKIPNEEEE